MLATATQIASDGLSTALIAALLIYLVRDTRQTRTRLVALETRLNARLAQIQERIDRIDPLTL